MIFVQHLTLIFVSVVSFFLEATPPYEPLVIIFSGVIPMMLIETSKKVHG